MFVYDISALGAARPLLGWYQESRAGLFLKHASRQPSFSPGLLQKKNTQFASSTGDLHLGKVRKATNSPQSQTGYICRILTAIFGWEMKLKFQVWPILWT